MNHLNHLLLKYSFVIICLVAFVSCQTYSSVWGPGRQMSCSDNYNTLIANKLTNLTLSNTRYFFGYTVNGLQNQNPCVARFDSQVQSWCRCDYETTAAFASAYGGMWDGDIDSLFVVFSTDGSVEDNFSRYTKDGWISSYGTPNFNEVAIILQLNENSGNPTGTGTYIEAINDFGGVQYSHLTFWKKEKVSTMTITFDAGEFPLNFDLTPQTCTDISLQPNQLYSWKIEIPLTLDFPVSTTANGCSGTLPPPSSTSTPKPGSATPTNSRTPSRTPSKGSPPSRSSSPSRRPGDNSSNTSNTSNSSDNNTSNTSNTSNSSNRSSNGSSNNSSSASSFFFSLSLFAVLVTLFI